MVSSIADPLTISHRGIFLREITTPSQRKEMEQLIASYHSYKQTSSFVGRQINWFIEFDGETIGAIGVGSVVMFQPQILYEYVGVKCNINAIRTFYLNRMAVNWRFTLKPNAPHNAGSQTLSCLTKVAPRRWKEKYGDELVLLTTLVETPRKGTIYKAAGWDYIGTTKSSGQLSHMPYGGAKHDAVGGKAIPKWIPVSKEGKTKLFFAKPLVRNWKELLIRRDSAISQTIKNTTLIGG